MFKIFSAFLLFCLSSLNTSAWSGKNYDILRLSRINEGGTHASRFNLKLQPAFYWSSLGVEAEYILNPKVSVALNAIVKLSGLDGKHSVKNNVSDKFLETGYMIELIGRYYISLTKKHLQLPPTGFYIQASAGFSKLQYFDGSTRPFSLNTRFPNNYDIEGNADFTEIIPFIAGVGAGYQVELLPGKVIANMLIGIQNNLDKKGSFLTFYASPSVGLMF